MTKKKSKKCNADFLPCYDYVVEAKKLCRPSPDIFRICNMSPDTYYITETQAIIPLQPLVVQTFNRILEIPRVTNSILEKKEAAGGQVVDLEGGLKAGSDT